MVGDMFETYSDYYLKHLALGTLIKEQVLLVERLQGLSCNLGFLFGFTSSIIQQVHLHIGSWGGEDGVTRERKERERLGQKIHLIVQLYNICFSVSHPAIRHKHKI